VDYLKIIFLFVFVQPIPSPFVAVPAYERDHNRKKTCKLQLHANNSLEKYSYVTYLARILFKKLFS